MTYRLSLSLLVLYVAYLAVGSIVATRSAEHIERRYAQQADQINQMMNTLPE